VFIHWILEKLISVLSFLFKKRQSLGKIHDNEELIEIIVSKA